MGRLFGTDGVRGVANRDLTYELAAQIGQAGAYVLGREACHTPKILIGMDTRRSGPMLEAALCAGIMSMGADVTCAGVIPTPAVAYLTRTLGFDAGIVVSASHNSAEFNGIKFFNSEGYKLRDEIEEEIEDIILNDEPVAERPIGADVGTVMRNETLLDRYVEFAKSTVGVDFSGMKIALDCANGASSRTAPQTFKALGAEIYVINSAPDGININRGCGSTHIEGLCEFVKNNRCDIGFAFDGDADRVLAVDSDGEVIDGDAIMAICASEMKKNGTLDKNTLVATIMSNLGLFKMGEREEIAIPRTKVGDRYVLEEMVDKGYVLGGEQSGHIIFLNYNTTGDGLVTALQLAQIVRKSGKTVQELKKVITIYPQVLKNARVAKSGDFTYVEDEVITNEINHLNAKYNGQGRVVIRPSGTEPLVRVMIEGQNQEEIASDAHTLASLIEERLGVKA